MADIKKIKLGGTTYNIVDGTHKNIIILEDNSSTTAGTWLAKTDRISAYTDGQLFMYKVTKAGGSSATTLNITGLTGETLGAKTIYRTGSTKLTTQYAVGSYIMLYYSSSLNNGSFLVVNDSDIKTTSGDTSSKIFLIGTTSQSTSGETTYSHDTAYVGTDGCLYSNKTKVSVVGHEHEVSTANAAPNAHTHTVVVNGNTDKNSGTGVTALTGVKVSSTSSAAPGGHTHDYSKTTSVKLTANTETGTGRITYVQSISAGSGSLASYDASSNGTVKTSNGNRIKYVDSISGGSVSASSTVTAAPNEHTHTYTTYSLSGSNSSHTTKYLKATPTAASTGTVTISGGSGSLEAYPTATGGTAVVTNGTRVPFITSLTNGSYTPAGSVNFTNGTAPSMGSATTKYLSASASGTAVGANGTGSVAPSGHTHTITVSGITGTNSGTAVKAVTGYSSFSGGSLTGTKTFNTDAIKSVGGTKNYGFSSSTSDVMYSPTVTDGVLSWSTTSASTQDAHTGMAASTGTVGFTAASLGTASTSDVAPAAHTHSYGSSTALTTSGNSGTAVTALTGVKITAQPTIALAANTSTAPGRIKYVEAQGTFSAGTTPPASATFAGTATTSLVTDGTKYYLAHGHTAATLGGTTTFNTDAIKSVALSASSTSSDGPAYVDTATNSSLSLTPAVNAGTTGKNSGTGVSAVGEISYTAPTATTYYLAHAHTVPSATTRYLSATPSRDIVATTVNNGTNFNAATAVTADGTASVAPNGHTHSYGSSTALTTSANSGSAVAAVTEVKPD